MTSPMPVRTVRLPDALWLRLEKEAERRRRATGALVTVADVIREALEQALP